MANPNLAFGVTRKGVDSVRRESRARDRKHAAELAYVRKAVIAAVPTTWLDSLLTGPDAVIGKQPFTGTDIERLLSAVKKRVEAAAYGPVK